SWSSTEQLLRRWLMSNIAMVITQIEFAPRVRLPARQAAWGSATRELWLTAMSFVFPDGSAVYALPLYLPVHQAALSFAKGI
ncbi:MAG TPA: hypothetical protein VK602_02355, partial [Phyllobacterium sp.]|nr:hypothetical protein [Phyllobacterium sp.]